MVKFSPEVKYIMGAMKKEFGKFPIPSVKSPKLSIWNRVSPLKQLQTDIFQHVSFDRSTEILKNLSIGKTYFKDNFNESKKTLLEHVEKSPFRSEEIVKRIKSANESEELYKAVVDYQSEILAKTYAKDSKVAPLSLCPKGRITLEYEQAETKLSKERARSIYDLQKRLIKKSENPNVIEIEEKLMHDFGIKAHLNDDLEKAENVYKAVQNARKANSPLPSEILISDISTAGGEVLQVNGIAGKKVILLGSSNYYRNLNNEANHGPAREYLEHLPENKQDAYSKLAQSVMFSPFYSTESPIHAETHELAHLEHYMTQSFAYKCIPAKFKETIRKLSAYAHLSNNNWEIRTELATKQRLDKTFTKDEAELFKHLGGKVDKSTQIVDDHETFKIGLRDYVKKSNNSQ